MARKSTRNAQGSGSIRQRSDGRWEARYTIGRDPGTGKQIQKSIYAKTQKEVVEKLRHLQTEIDNGTYVEPSKLTVGAWLDIWIGEYQNQLKERTKIEYIGTINNRIKPYIGAVIWQN